MSVRTIHRDVDALSASGVPISPSGVPWPACGWSTAIGPAHRDDRDEAEALFLGGRGSGRGARPGHRRPAARLKVLASLPTELGRAPRDSWSDSTSTRPAGSGPASPPRACRPSPRRSGRPPGVDLVRARRSTVERVLEPLGLVLKAGTWYIVAGSEGQVRTYRVSRVTDVRALEERFERPADFDLPAFWAESSAAYEREVPRIDVVVRVRPDRLELLGDAVGHRATEAAERLDEPDPEGWLRLKLRLDWPEEVPRRVLYAGKDVEVLEPAAIRERIARLAGGIVDRYEPAVEPG